MSNITEKQMKENEYTKYINEHIMNIHNAYVIYKDILCEKLNISPSLLLSNINKHDQSKYSDEEFNAYRNYFYPCNDEIKDEKMFNNAWEHHYKENPHHEDYWIDDSGIPKDMPKIYIAEMLLDWAAMAITFDDNVYEYYTKERDNKTFSDNTKKIIDSVIDIFKR